MPVTTWPVPAVLVSADEVVVTAKRGITLLDHVSLAVRAGELVAIVGPSGAGKTTLLRSLAGLQRPSRGRIDSLAGAIGYVPQDDIVHGALTARESVRFAARLRLGPSCRPDDADAAVASTLLRLGLSAHADVAVAALSGGQRKRVSIATELVARPDVCFLDEPTSGLDPAAGADLMATLRRLADSGTAVVVTTHQLADLGMVDRVVVVAPGGRVEYVGTPDDAPGPYRVSRARCDRRAPSPVEGECARRGTASKRSQVATLTRRTALVLRRDRMSAAIMAGSPVAVVGMLAVLFGRRVAGTDADGSLAVAFAYWLAFAGFFFGLTFGLLQICTEVAIVRREAHGVVALGAYLSAKLAVLVPVLALVDATMLGVLVGGGRITGLSGTQVLGVQVVLVLDSLAGLAMGLCASAAVTSTSQATLALPMLCFPAVLFGGAIVPVAAMTIVGRSLASVTSTRWAFDAVTRFIGGASGSAVVPCMVMTVIAAVALLGSRAALAWRVHTDR